jgi:hypothetical protein
MSGWKWVAGIAAILGLGWAASQDWEEKPTAPPSPPGSGPPLPKGWIGADSGPGGGTRISNVPWTRWDADGLQYLTVEGQRGIAPILAAMQSAPQAQVPDPQTPAYITEYLIGDAGLPSSKGGPTAMERLAQIIGNNAYAFLPIDTIQAWQNEGRNSGSSVYDRMFAIGRGTVTPEFVQANPDLLKWLVVIS